MAGENTPANPAEWVAQIRTLRKKADLKGALEDCLKAMQAFPDSTDLLFLYGEVRIDCFNQAKKPEHLKAALISFEKLLKANPRHYMANLLAARIYYKGRAWARAGEKLAAILKMSPSDPRALELKGIVQKTKGGQKAAPKAAEMPVAAPEKAEPAEEAEEFGDDAIARESIEGLKAGVEAEYDNLITRFSIFSRLDGVRAIHLVDHAGVEIKSVLKGEKGGGLNNLATNMANIFVASRLCAQKTGLGTFQRGLLLTSSGNVMIVNVFYGLLALVLDPDADLKAVEGRVNRYVEALTE